MLWGEIRPQNIRKPIFSVSRLPDKIIRKSVFTAWSYDKIRIRHTGSIKIIGNGIFGYVFRRNSIINNTNNISLKEILTKRKSAREFRFGLTRNFENDNFKDSFYHGIIDLIYFDNDELNICDYKTGKYKENQDFSQLLIYSLFFKNYDKIKINYLPSSW